MIDPEIASVPPVAGSVASRLANVEREIDAA